MHVSAGKVIKKNIKNDQRINTMTFTVTNGRKLFMH